MTTCTCPMGVRESGEHSWACDEAYDDRNALDTGEPDRWPEDDEEPNRDDIEAGISLRHALRGER